jgi:uncharacterized RDD family membrane protein YckC
MDEPRRGPQQLAEWWPRVGATLLDIVIVWVLALAALIGAAIFATVTGISEDPTGWLWLLLWFVLGSVYTGGLMSRKGRYNGQTLGKQAAGIRVVRDDGRPVTFKTAFVRDVLLKLVAGNVTFGIGWVVDSMWPLGERENRALHDVAVHTHVVNTRPAPRPQIQQSRPTVQQPVLAPPIARHVDAARRSQAGIAAAVQRAQLPYTAVSREVDALMGLLSNSAQRAQMLYEALDETPVARVEQRLAALTDGFQPELEGALREQLIVQRRMQGQLARYDGELERIVVELDTVRANVVSAAASGDADNQERLADAVRGLRDEMSAVAEGMDRAYGT